jgi:hypothetical protein
MKNVLSFDVIKSLYPNEWVLMEIEKHDPHTKVNEGEVLLHGKDGLEISYRASELYREVFTKMMYTGEKKSRQKWLKHSIINENPKTI